MAECDGRQIAQALTNLLKNAAEAIDARIPPLHGLLLPGEIRLGVSADKDRRFCRSRITAKAYQSKNATA